ncbi:unnamed protein product [Rotaria sp. Silwood1]|nr:unnamed protein product [Rotaria sp. Silwood1]CAF4609730.1 unnamed protein product [Rotaria sp. Silwood1]CAF4677669.1 unnamed protein product [Rotaria sp. Silwood1]
MLKLLTLIIKGVSGHYHFFLTPKSAINTNDELAFRSISSIKSNQFEEINSNESLFNNFTIPNLILSPFISLSNNLHSHHAL